MVLKFIGSKPLISQRGVHFDQRKKDKYIYLNFVVELIKALDHEYTTKDPYTYDISTHLCDGEHYFAFLEHRNPSIREEVEFYRKQTEEEVETEVRHVEAHSLFSEEEKESFIRNLNLMRDYRIGRAMNKAAYYNGINYLAQIIHDRRVAYVTAPLLPIYFHIFHSIQGAMAKRHPPMQSTIDIFEKNGVLYTRLTVNY